MPDYVVLSGLKVKNSVISHLLFNRIVYRQYHMGNCCWAGPPVFRERPLTSMA
jgi:hypothetical protein